jgi:hypothetical protein
MTQGFPRPVVAAGRCSSFDRATIVGNEVGSALAEASSEEAASKETASKEATSQKATSKGATSIEAFSKEEALQEAASNEAASKEAASQEKASRESTSKEAPSKVLWMLRIVPAGFSCDASADSGSCSEAVKMFVLKLATFRR